MSGFARDDLPLKPLHPRRQRQGRSGCDSSRDRVEWSYVRAPIGRWNDGYSMCARSSVVMPEPVVIVSLLFALLELSATVAPLGLMRPLTLMGGRVPRT